MNSPTFRLHLRVPLPRLTAELDLETTERVLGLFGPSGAGKTSLLEALAGWRPNATGLIEVEGRVLLDSAAGLRLPPEQRRIGYVPQDTLLFPHWDVGKNVEAGTPRGPARRAPARIRSERVLEVLDLAGFERREVAGLSAGERQRVALARALVSDPALLLLDEPLANLDAPLRRRLLSYLLRVLDEFRIPTIFVSHDAAEVETLCTLVAVLERGRLLAAGPPAQVFLAPGIFPLAEAGGFENVLTGVVEAADGGAARVRLGAEGVRGAILHCPAAGLRPGVVAVLGLPAEEVLLASVPPVGLSARNILPGAVRRVSQVGQAVLVVVGLEHGGAEVVAKVSAEACSELGIREGRPVHLVIKSQSFRLLGTGGTAGPGR
ncbi:MAG: ATP-binding cassette domain-containing protein [Planctomycetes bacterium]|nr:ATP-binding cassette domain-containing protein [Planctomycetota bacterium]